MPICNSNDVITLADKPIEVYKGTLGRATFLEPTMELRWHTVPAEPPVLQQKWIDRFSGEFEWQDIPFD
jgi:hypothetical protein